MNILSISSLLIAALSLAACVTNAPPRNSLHGTDAGTIAFYSAGSVAQISGDNSRRFEITSSGAAVSGELRFPSGNGPFPAVVLAHGCGGVVPLPPREARWASLLREWGYATFIVDSFSGRNISETCSAPSRLYTIQRVPDAYGALRILGTHPQIDRSRIFLIGWSNGGGLVVNAATKWAADTFAGRDGPRFRGFVAFYPPCNLGAPERQQLAAPIRIHTGALDNWTPTEPCEILVGEMRQRGLDAEMTIYPNAHHSFDAPRQRDTVITQALNFTNCGPIREASILGPVTTSTQGCQSRGATVGYNYGATRAAELAVKEQLIRMGQSP